MRHSGSTDRRSFLQTALAASLCGCAATRPVPASARVLVVGGGFGGSTAAKYLRAFSGNTLDVVLVEPGTAFVSCPMSNLVLGGSRSLASLTTSYWARTVRADSLA